MSWSGIANNQAVSCNNLQDAVNNNIFTLKSAIPSSEKLVTKTEASGYVNLDETYAPFAADASNQLIVKSVLQPGASLATIYIATNGSLDIELNLWNIAVNGVGVVNVSGIDPNTPGNGGSVQTNQIGTYNINLTYQSSIPGQHIELIDSAFNYHCNNTSPGFNSMTFYGVVINTSADLTLFCLDGDCLAP